MTSIVDPARATRLDELRRMTERSVGVEEEFLLVSSGPSRLAAAGDAVVARAETLDRGAQFEHELKQEQVELGTRPAVSLDELDVELRRLRRELGAASAARGARLIASGTSPLAVDPTGTMEPRYARMMHEFGVIARDQLTCGMHVHISVESSDEGVGVLDRIRPWLALLTALSANSPLSCGTETGYASYRSRLWGQWPTAGPVESFGDQPAYDRLRRQLIASGAAMDDGMIYFDARLSVRYPTVEIRVADVCVHAEDAVTIAGLARALVSTAAQQWRDGVVPAPIRSELLRAASWRSARDGMTGELVALSAVAAGSDEVLIPAWQLCDELVHYVEPALNATGDASGVWSGLAAIRARGTGAALQRSAFARGGGTAVVDALCAATVGPAR